MHNDGRTGQGHWMFRETSDGARRRRKGDYKINIGQRRNPLIAVKKDNLHSRQILSATFFSVHILLSRLPKHYTPLHLYIPTHHQDFIY
jgi:hypothetical protein